MNETTKYLSAKAVSDLKEEMRNAKNIHDTLDLKDASISARLISNFEAEHFAVQIGNEKINCRKANSTEIRKVTAGVFKGLFALIEHEGQKVNVYLIYPKGYVQLAKNEKLDNSGINQLFDKEAIAKLTASKLNKFDLDKRVQDYQLFCERLPNCLFNPKNNFENNVLKYFFANDIVFEQSKHLALIKKSECKRFILSYFTKLLKKKEAEFFEERELV